MNPIDIQQAQEFKRWLGEKTGLGPKPVTYLCLFFYGLDVVNDLKHEVFAEFMEKEA